MIQKNIKALVAYALKTGLIEKSDEIYTTNRLLELFGLDTIEETEGQKGKGDCEEAKNDEISNNEISLEEILSPMLDYAYKAGLIKENSITYRDLFDTKIMGLLLPRPSG